MIILTLWTSYILISPPLLWTSEVNFTPLPSRHRKFPLWGGCGSFLERPITELRVWIWLFWTFVVVLQLSHIDQYMAVQLYSSTTTKVQNNGFTTVDVLNEDAAQTVVWALQKPILVMGFSNCSIMLQLFNQSTEIFWYIKQNNIHECLELYIYIYIWNLFLMLNRISH